MNLRPYPKYKDSGIEWIGKIPEDWEVKRLKYVCPISKEKLDSKPDELPYLGLENIDSWTGELLLDNELEEIESSVNKFNKGDVLLGKLRPYLAKVHLAEIDGVSTTELVALKVRDNIYNRYTFYQVISHRFISVLNAVSYGVKMPRSSPMQIENMMMLIPSLNKQIAISNYLDKETSEFRKLIEKYQQFIELLKEKRIALIIHVVTKGLDPDVKMKDSGVEWIGKIPEHWEVKRLKYVSKVIMGQSPSSEDYNIQGLGFPFLQGNADFGNIFPTPETYCDKGKKFSEKDDILISVRAPVGEINIADQKYAIGRGLASIRFQNLNMRDYTWYGLNVFKLIFNYQASGSTYDAVSVDDVRSILVLIPKDKEQQDIVNYLNNETSKIDNLIEKINKQVELLNEYKTSLISHTVTGKFDVRGVA